MVVWTRRQLAGLAGAAGVINFAQGSPVQAPPRLSQLVGPPRLAPSWVAVGQKVLALGSNSDGGGTNTTSRQQFGILNTGSDITSIRVAFPNWKLNGGAAESPGNNSIQICAAIMFPFSSYYRLTFSGLPSIQLPAGATVWSDPVPVYVPKGTRFYIRSFCSVLAGQSWPRGVVPVVANGDQSEEGLGLTDNTLGGTYSGTNGACYGPCAVVGMTATPTASVLLLTDSLGWGQGDDPSGISSTPTGDGNGNYGPFQRAFFNAGIGFVKMTKSGLYARDVVGQNIRTRLFAPYCGSAVVILGTNDLTGNQPLSAIQAALREIWGSLAAQGCRVFACTVPPKTNSTDGWMSLGNQSMPSANYGAPGGGLGSVRAQLNDWLRSGPSSTVFGVLECADPVEAGRNSGIWRPGYTNDGTHWNQVGMTAVLDVVNNAILGGFFV